MAITIPIRVLWPAAGAQVAGTATHSDPTGDPVLSFSNLLNSVPLTDSQPNLEVVQHLQITPHDLRLIASVPANSVTQLFQDLAVHAVSSAIRNPGRPTGLTTMTTPGEDEPANDAQPDLGQPDQPGSPAVVRDAGLLFVNIPAAVVASLAHATNPPADSATVSSPAAPAVAMIDRGPGQLAFTARITAVADKSPQLVAAPVFSQDKRPVEGVHEASAGIAETPISTAVLNESPEVFKGTVLEAQPLSTVPTPTTPHQERKTESGLIKEGEEVSDMPRPVVMESRFSSASPAPSDLKTPTASFPDHDIQATPPVGVPQSSGAQRPVMNSQAPTLAADETGSTQTSAKPAPITPLNPTTISPAQPMLTPSSFIAWPTTPVDVATISQAPFRPVSLSNTQRLPTETEVPPTAVDVSTNARPSRTPVSPSDAPQPSAEIGLPQLSKSTAQPVSYTQHPAPTLDSPAAIIRGAAPAAQSKLPAPSGTTLSAPVLHKGQPVQAAVDSSLPRRALELDVNSQSGNNSGSGDSGSPGNRKSTAAAMPRVDAQDDSPSSPASTDLHSQDEPRSTKPILGEPVIGRPEASTQAPEQHSGMLPSLATPQAHITAPTARATSTSAVPLPTSTLPTSMLIEPQQRGSGSVRAVTIDLASEARQVRVQLSDRAGELHVAVRTADAELTTGLRNGLPGLVEHLRQAGYETQTSVPTAATEQRFEAGTNEPDQQFHGGQNQSDTGGSPNEQGGRKRNPLEWLSGLDEQENATRTELTPNS